MRITLDHVDAWAMNDCPELDQLFEDDPDSFEHEMSNLCGDEKLLELAANTACTKRRFFASLLAQSLCWVYRSDVGLPFHFSRFMGIMSQAEFEQNAKKYIESAYKKAEMIDKMRSNDDKAIQALYKQLMDFRHEKIKMHSDFYYSALKALHADSLTVFPDA